MNNKKQFKVPEYVYFVFARGTNSGYGFSTYTDHVGALGSPGAVVSISYQLDKNQRPIPYFFSMGTRDRSLKVEKNKVDMKGVSVVEFLRNSPDCKGSPNGSYRIPGDVSTQSDIYFKEMNEEDDAKNALDAKNYRREAENIAASLTLDEVYDINAMLGSFKKGELLARHFLAEIAGNKPEMFMNAYNHPQRKSIALIKKGLINKTLTSQGTVILWGKTTLGLDEIDAATNIQKDKKMMEALEKALQ